MVPGSKLTSTVSVLKPRLASPITIILYTVLVGHRRVAGSNKSSHYDHRLIPCAVGSVPVRLGMMYKTCREEPKHRNNNVCSRTLTGTWIQEEPKHRKDLERSADFRSDLVRKAASERGGAV